MNLPDTELELANMCKTICDRYDYIKKVAGDPSDILLADRLYHKIFYKGDFEFLVYNKPRQYQEDYHSKMYHCEKCQKKIFNYLHIFARVVLLT